MPAVTVIAAFDFDGTLTRRDTLNPFLARGLGWPRYLWTLLRCSPWLAGYALRLVRNDVAKAHLLQLALGGRSLAEMDDWTTRWLAQDLPGQLQDWTLARLREHQQAGHCCVLVSASPDIYLARLAKQLGFDALICTEMEVEGEHLTGRMRTPNCYGEQKVIRLQAWLSERFGLASFAGTTFYAYGDTSGDKPMLRLAQHAWYRGQPWRETAPAQAVG
ncbi:phosphatidylglycerophosphatase C [Polaromonas sp. OV174]|uniref:HAD-IB family hydrolase n=1 Tax=Polaromonas sp. OV174 TaxID=1855300 RepID=UPI0008E8F783|nr:HAD-IB family hydrolase [Polaromonas sp. OV174]SFC16921.1 phosphatidylglycerophosphatase C [Polaromonas sp. OV174]